MSKFQQQMFPLDGESDQEHEDRMDLLFAHLSESDQKIFEQELDELHFVLGAACFVGSIVVRMFKKSNELNSSPPVLSR